MISLLEARDLLVRHCTPLPAETLAIGKALGRNSAASIDARTASPPADLSAMDGFAVRQGDCAVGAVLDIVGESRAGAPFDGVIGPGQAVHISTGAHVPAGSDHVLIVEHAVVEEDRVRVAEAQTATRHIRPAGLDFSKGDRLIDKGQAMTPARLALVAAGGHATIEAIRAVRIAIMTNGDELRDLGAAPDARAVFDSNAVGLAAQFESFGADARWIGRAGDRQDEVVATMQDGMQDDLLVIAGGASVGRHDLVKAAFARLSGQIVFSKVAVRPGKPVWFGTLPGGPLVLGLPGNPASAFVTALLFGRLAVDRLSGRPVEPDLAAVMRRAVLDEDLPANGPRDAFLRAALRPGTDGTMHIALTGAQDSSLLRPLAAADALLFRDAGAPELAAGGTVSFLPLS
jgi:molybdopterin molybdotransferase